MKKYSDEHLEGVEPEFINAAEYTISQLSDGICSSMTCPSIILDPNFKLNDGWGFFACSDDNGYWCNDNMQYGALNCPCYAFGAKKSLKIFKNLVSQWKKWAGIDE